MIAEQLKRMLPLRRILLATDGSEYSENAVAVAIEVARQFNARLVAMSMVLLAEDLEMVGTHGLRQDQESQAQARLDQVAAAARAAGVVCETLIRYGEEPYEEIVDAAEELEAGLIVMGRRGRRGLARLMVGDATAKVVGHASCNVLVVPRSARMWHRRVLLATDGSTHAEAAAAAAITMASKGSLPMTVVSATVRSHSQERRDEARKAVDKVAAAVAASGIAADEVLSEGRPDEVIVDTAAAEFADLIVVGSHGRTGVAKILLGSVSERVIGAARCPVLVSRS